MPYAEVRSLNVEAKVLMQDSEAKFRMEDAEAKVQMLKFEAKVWGRSLRLKSEAEVWGWNPRAELWGPRFEVWIHSHQSPKPEVWSSHSLTAIRSRSTSHVEFPFWMRTYFGAWGTKHFLGSGLGSVYLIYVNIPVTCSLRSESWCSRTLTVRTTPVLMHNHFHPRIISFTLHHLHSIDSRPNSSSLTKTADTSFY